jgi:predicted transcriptional regulator
MYQANLSFRLLQKYLAHMSVSSLIFFNDETKSFSLTSKGKDFLETYKQYSRTNRQAERVFFKVIAKKQTLEKLSNQ